MFETPYFDYGNTIGQLEIPISTTDFIVGPQNGVEKNWHMGFHDLSLLIYFNDIMCVYVSP